MSFPMTLAQIDPDAAGGILAGGAFLIIWALVFVVSIGLMIWAIVDAVKNPGLSDTERIVWIIVIVFLGCLGAAVYLLVARNKGPGGPRTET